MPVVGFTDLDGRRFDFGALAGGNWPAPLTFVKLLASQYRGADHYGDNDVISVTTLIAPVQQVRLIERHDVYVDPYDNLWAAFGTLGHTALEAMAADDPSMIAEVRLVVERDGRLIGGTFDLIESEGGEWIGRDYKITAAYGVAKQLAEGVYKGKPEYNRQGNIYRQMIADPTARMVVEHADGTKTLGPWPHAGLQVAKWQLVAWSRDWKADRGKDTMTVYPYGDDGPLGATPVRPVEMLDCKLFPSATIETYLRQRLVEYAASELCDDAGLPQCTDAETWNGRRCAKYCSAAGNCWQYNNGDPAKTRRRRK